MRILLTLLLCLPGWVNAEIYLWQDAQGNKHFSDRPVADAKIVDIKPGYGFNAVKTVYDGDAVVLEDGRKIRLLGIHTPEVQHRDKLADAGGDEAKRWLTDKLKKNQSPPGNRYGKNRQIRQNTGAFIHRKRRAY